MQEPMSLLSSHFLRIIPDLQEWPQKLQEYLQTERLVWWWSLCSANAQQISIPSPIAECVYHVMDSERPEKTKLVQELIGVANFDLSNFEGSALFPTMSKFNHNCNPNVEILAVPETGDTPSAGSKQVLQNRFIARARRKIHVNEEMCISYLDLLDPQSRDARRKELKERYGFICQCVSCCAEGMRTK
mmetsp:Transcript_9320/g.31179  ORF Transcript_9320/g.31179 Transcript_9320/m.31179 type:complete len:188 (-) Transcript_9320:18-581(-)